EAAGAHARAGGGPGGCPPGARRRSGPGGRTPPSGDGFHLAVASRGRGEAVRPPLPGDRAGGAAGAAVPRGADAAVRTDGPGGGAAGLLVVHADLARTSALARPRGDRAVRGPGRGPPGRGEGARGPGHGAASEVRGATVRPQDAAEPRARGRPGDVAPSPHG